VPLKGVLLDIDGTLLLSNDAHAQAWVDAYQEFGYNVPFEKIQPLIGMGGDKLMATVTPELHSDQGAGKEITTLRQKIFLERYVENIQPAPGARELVQRLGELGLKLTVATSAKNDELDSLLGQAGVADLIGRTTTADDAEESKPDPDIVEAALQKSKLAPDEVLMIGDTPYDIESAGKAGVGVVAVRCGGHDRDLEGAIAVYDDPADILEHFESSPFAVAIRAPANP
jgi:HAD superfamily hydrolase (TIGR01509 family)